MVWLPVVALLSIVSVAVAFAGSVTITLLTVMPAPLAEKLMPLAKPVPVILMLTVVPGAPVAGLINVNVGAGVLAGKAVELHDSQSYINPCVLFVPIALMWMLSMDERIFVPVTVTILNELAAQ